MFANLTIRARLVLAMALLTLALATVAVIGLYGLQEANMGMQAIYAERMLRALDLENIDRLQLNNRLRINIALVTPTPEVIREREDCRHHRRHR
jgi:Tar ligand binding domain homologue